MKRDILLWVVASLLTCFLLGALAPTAEAGPPLICFPYDIGNAPSLPWGAGQGWKTISSSYDLNRLVDDTLALLGSSTPLIVRMETLRRATIYATNDAQVAAALAARLEERVRTSEAKGAADPLALFDYGYLVEAYKQAQKAFGAATAAPAVDGRALIERALRMRGNDPEMEFAAAMASVDGRSSASAAEHLRKAVAGAREGSLLAANLISHGQLFGRHAANLAELRAQVLPQ